jgi:hypothetical protein
VLPTSASPPDPHPIAAAAIASSTTFFDGNAFKQTVCEAAGAFETLALAMLPLYAEALGLNPAYFTPAFDSALYRFRLSHYPPTPAGEFGINPHIDTSFFTLLATTDSTGLVVYSHARNCWVRARHGARFMRGVCALNDASIGSHACLQSSQQWVTEFMVSARGCYSFNGSHACWLQPCQQQHTCDPKALDLGCHLL